MGLKIYNALVNKQPGIRARYHAYHDTASGFKKVLSYLYLLWINFAFYVLHIKSIGETEDHAVYEEKKLITDMSESEAHLKAHPELTVEGYVNRLKDYDIISFDIFDTLILRSLSEPVDVFWFLSRDLELMDIKRLRMLSEYEARQKQKKEKGTYEINLDDIWQDLAKKTDVTVSDAEKEKELELAFCYANPFMLKVWERLKELGKDIIVVSDMYLPSDFLKTLLEKNGFTGYKKLFVSNEYAKSKADGSLFEYVKGELGSEFNADKDSAEPSIEGIEKAAETNSGDAAEKTAVTDTGAQTKSIINDCPDGRQLRLIHVGDNEVSDLANAKAKGFDAILYPHTGKAGKQYRASDMSYLTGSAYRAVVNNHLYNGLAVYDIDYEYGFIYGGLFVTGYCRFIHDYCEKNGVERVLFLSRDGDILKQAYDIMYPEADTRYVYWSRKVATKLISDHDRIDFFRRFIHHKVNQSITIGSALKAMELSGLSAKLAENGLSENSFLTNNNSMKFQSFLEENWEEVQRLFIPQHEAAACYYRKMLEGVKKAVCVDIGWAGSGPLSIAYLTSHKWDIDCSITGIIAGTNTIHNAEPDATEPFIKEGKIVPYLFSQSFNRDVLKKHDPNRNFNVYWELLLSSPTAQFTGFYPGNCAEAGDTYLKENDITLKFGSFDANCEGIKQIQNGVLDFVRLYTERFEQFPFMLEISGRDAYAPVLAACGKNEKYLKMIEKRYDLQINVN